MKQFAQTSRPERSWIPELACSRAQRGLTEGILPSLCSGPGGACLLSPSCPDTHPARCTASKRDHLSRARGRAGGTTHGAGRERSPLGVGADRAAPLGTETGARSAWVTIPALTTTQPSDSGCSLFHLSRPVFSPAQPAHPETPRACGREGTSSATPESGFPGAPNVEPAHPSRQPPTAGSVHSPPSVPRAPARFTKNSRSLPGWARKPVAGQEAARLHQGSNEQPVH